MALVRKQGEGNENWRVCKCVARSNRRNAYNKQNLFVCTYGQIEIEIELNQIILLVVEVNLSTPRVVPLVFSSLFSRLSHLPLTSCFSSSPLFSVLSLNT